MDVVQMHNRIEFYIDKSKSPRFQSSFHYDQSLNIAQDALIQDKYDNIKQHKEYAFQVFQKVRDDLRTIVKNVNITPVGNLIVYPPDYLYEVGLAVTIGGVQYSSSSITYNQVNIQDNNSFTEQAVDEPTHIEDQNGITVMFGTSNAVFSSAKLSYISIPPVIAKGEVNITQGPFVLVVGQTYYVTVAGVTTTINGVPGTTVPINTDFVAEVSSFTGAGTVIQIVNCILPSSCHEELCKRASQILVMTVDAVNKSRSLDAEASKV